MQNTILKVVFIKMLILAACSAPPENFFVGKWEAIEYTVNGADQLAINNVTFVFDDDGNFQQNIVTNEHVRSDTGFWEFNHADGTFKLTYERNNQVVVWNVMEQKGNVFQMNNQEYRGFYVEWKFRRSD